MNYLLSFKDDGLEKQFQNDKKLAKPLNFYSYLLLEFSLSCLIVIVNYFTEVLKSFVAAALMFLLFIGLDIFTIILVKKLRNFKYLIHFFVLLHVISLICFILIEGLRGEDLPDYYLLLSILNSAFHLHFVSILMTRIKWYWASLWDFIYHIFYIFLSYPINIISEYYQFMFLIHFFCFISFVMLAYDQEKLLRDVYNIIRDSNEQLNEYRILIKNVIPFPTVIFEIDQKNVEFINNSAMSLIKNDIPESPLNEIIHPEEQILINCNILNEKKLHFSELEDFLKKCEILENGLIDNKENNLFYEIISQMKNDLKIFKIFQEKLEFHQINVKFKSHRRLCECYLNIKFLKIIWNKKPCILLIINDVTDLNKIKQLQSLDEYKNQLLATVSHDLRTPLNGIIGIIGMVLPNIQLKKDRKNLNIALNSGNLLTHMINDILDFSQINSHKLRVIQEKVHLTKLIKETVKIIKFQIVAKGLKFILDCKIMKAEVISDYCRLKQILLNLLTNASKFTLKGYIRLSLESQDDNYKIMVEDTGIGIKPEDKPKLFLLFGKLDSTIFNRTGRGLGLNISNNLVKLLNPDDQNGLHLETEWSKGSKFWFFLKKYQNNEIDDMHSSKIGHSSDSSDEKYEALVNKRVLIADDDAVNVLVAEMYCKHYNMDCKSVNNGREAVEYIKNEVINGNNIIDVILMDCNMPILDGYDATIEILNSLKNNNKAIIPIIGATANILPEDIDKCLKVGMKNYLIKPIKRKDFGNCLMKLFI